jgi:hypothetical protein
VPRSSVFGFGVPVVILGLLLMLLVRCAIDSLLTENYSQTIVSAFMDRGMSMPIGMSAMPEIVDGSVSVSPARRYS